MNKCLRKRGVEGGETSKSFQTNQWIDNEVVRCQFEDVRHGKRLRQLLEQLSVKVGATTPWACQDWADTKAAYRFFDNDRIGKANILAGLRPGRRTRRCLLQPHRNGQAPTASIRRPLCATSSSASTITPSIASRNCCPAHREELSSRRRGLSQITASKDPVAELLPSLAGFLDDGSITLGIVEPVGFVATAADGYNCPAMLVRRQNETLTELLLRPDHAIGLALIEDIFTDEVNARPRK